MGAYIIRRFLQLIPLLLGITLLTFLMFHLGPADPIQILLGEAGTREAVEAERARLGLDQPGYIQYAIFLANTLRGDLGVSYRSRQPVVTIIAPAFRATMYLAFFSMVITVLIGIPAGIFSATNRGGLFDQVTMSITMIGISSPAFFIGILLLFIFSFRLGWFPSHGMREWNSVVLPAFTVGIHFGAMLARMSRSAMLEVLSEDYIRTAKSKGLSRFRVEYKHALRNASLPIVTLIGLQAGQILGGAVISETVFAWPGLGRLLLNAILWHDAPLVQAGVLIIALVFSLVMLAVDLIYVLLNPTIRYE